MINKLTWSDEMDQDKKCNETTQVTDEVLQIQKDLEAKSAVISIISENLLAGILITAISEGLPVIWCNQYYLETIKYPEEEILGRTASWGIVPNDAIQLIQKTRDQLLKGIDILIEYRVHFKKGGARWISFRGRRTLLRDQPVIVWMLTDISGMKEAELDIKINEERYRIAMQNTEDIVLDFDIKTHAMYHSPKATEVYGVPEIVKNMPQTILDCGMVLPESVEVYLDLFRQLSDGVKKCSCILRTRTANGRILWNRLSFTVIFDDEDNPVRAIGILRDITYEKDVELRYKRETRYRELIGRDGVMYYEADITRQQFLSGHEDIVNAYLNQPTDDFNTVMELLLAHFVYEADRDLVRSRTSLEAINRDYEAGIMCTSFEYRRNIGTEPAWMECSMQFFFDEESKSLHYIACLKDINEAKQREISLRQKAEIDLLTGLYNKVTTELLIKERTDSSQENQVGGAFLIVGRIGGDEFVAYIHKVHDVLIIEKKARQICDMFHSMYTGNHNNYKISGTIGIALFPTHGKNFQELYQNADRALYAAKRRGKDTFSICTADLQDTAYIPPVPRQIDANAGKLFAENISEYVLRILYESSDSSRATCAILELISKHFNFSRGYIFEFTDHEWKSTFEWCAKNVNSPVIKLQEFPWKILKNNGDQFSNSGIFMINSSTEQEEELAFLNTQDFRSLVWFSIMNNGILQAIIGFDDCINEKQLPQEGLLVLQQASMLIGTFLMNSRSKENLRNPSTAAERVMDSVEDALYVINPNDFSLCYLNRKTRLTIPTARLGAKCYESLCGRDKPCGNCSLQLFLQGNTRKLRRKMFSTSQNRWVDITVSKIPWQDGKEYCLMNCVELLEEEEIGNMI